VLIAWFTSVVRLVGNVSIAVVLLYGGLRVATGTLELGVLTAFVLYLRRFYDPLDELAMFANSYSSAAAALEKISGVLEERPAVVNPARPVVLDAPRGEVVFDGVRFGYGSGPPVLPRLDLVVPAGQTIALVAPPGPASPPWRSCSPASMTRWRVRCASTASTCGPSRTPTCAARW